LPEKVARRLPTVRLFHSTDIASAWTICEAGFLGSRVRDSQGKVWLAESMEGAVGSAYATGCFVVVDLPDELAERHRYRFDDGSPYLDAFLVPVETVNSARPFGIEI
jgi:hypothetical protein